MKWILAFLFALMTTANSHACSMTWYSQDEVVLAALRYTSNSHTAFCGRVDGAEYVYREGAVFPPPPPPPQWSEDCPQSGPTTCVIAAGLGPDRREHPRPISLDLTWHVDEAVFGAVGQVFEDRMEHIQFHRGCNIRIPRIGERWLVIHGPRDGDVRRYYGSDAELITAALERRD